MSIEMEEVLQISAERKITFLVAGAEEIGRTIFNVVDRLRYMSVLS